MVMATYKTLDRTAELTAAIQQLEKLTHAIGQHERSPKAPSQSLMDKMRRFGEWLFAKEASIPKAMVAAELPQIIDKITQALPLLSQLQHGNPEQQGFANRAIQVIEDYNAAIDHIAQQASPTKNLPLAGSKIAFSAVSCLKRKVEWPTIKNQFHSKVDDAFRSQLAPPCTLDGKELDLFRVKAITLLRQWGLSVQEAIEAVNSAPVVMWQENIDFFNAVQTLSPLPGEKIILTALFQRINAHAGNSVPLHYQLFSLCSQTAFPSPCLHTGGWTLAAEMLPKLSAFHPAPSWESLYRQGDPLAQSLLPKGPRYHHAKTLRSLKKAAFEENRHFFLELHAQLAAAMLTMAGCDAIQKDLSSSFFSEIDKSHRPFKALVEAYQLFSDTYIIKPAWQPHNLLSQSIASGEHALAERSINARTPWHYLMPSFALLMGKALTPSLLKLLPWLQGLPLSSPLTNLDRALLLSLYHQQENFIREMDVVAPDIESVQNNMQSYLKRDIALFTTGESAASPEAQAALQELIKEKLTQSGISFTSRR